MYLEITDYRDFEVLRSSLVCSATNLLELNDLAERLSRLNEVQRIAFEGLVRVDFQKQESITLKRLRDLTESVDCCHVVESVVSDGQLGRFYAENGFVPEVEGMSDAAFELLDFEKVGKMARMGECGVYVPSGISGLGGYVVQHSDLKSAPEITLNQPVEPAYTIHLRLTAHHDNLPFAGTDVVDLKLPAEDNALEMAVRCLGYADWGAVECTCLDCKVPQLAEHITNAVPFETIERLGDVLAQMSAAALPAYKALMTATHCQNIVDALDLAEQVDEYILSPSIASPEDAAAEELAFILPEKAAKMIRPHINLHTYGQALLASRNNIQTEYGLLERRDGQSIQTIGQQKQEPQLGGMELGYGEQELETSDLPDALQALTADSFTGEEPTGQEEISFTLRLSLEGEPTVSIQFCRYDGAYCLAVVDGQPTALVTRSQVVDLQEAVYAVVLGES